MLLKRAHTHTHRAAKEVENGLLAFELRHLNFVENFYIIRVPVAVPMTALYPLNDAMLNE